jgi:hypothetical protein
MANQFSDSLSKGFNAGSAPQALRARIDARTVGFPAEDDPSRIQWMGMSPAPGTDDGWYVLVVKEEPNQYLAQVNKNERLVEISSVIGKGNPMTFEKAVEYLAVWEYARMAKGASPIKEQDRTALGKHYYKDLIMRRGYLVDTTGNLAEVADILPAQSGKFLKSDLDALEQYQDGLKGENILNELIQSNDPVFISETSIEEDLKSFGDITLFNKMRFFVETLVRYAEIKLKYVQDFYADPTRADGQDLVTFLGKQGFFNADGINQINGLKKELLGGVFRYFHVDESDWGKDLDFASPDLRRELQENPDAQETVNYFTRKINFPLGEEDLDTILFISARTLVYFREMLKDNPQKDTMERLGVYKQGDIDDLLNYLDLLEIKYQYKDLAEAALALPGTQKYAEMEQKKEDFKERITNFKANLKEKQSLSPAQEKQVDGFIRASTPIYLLDRIADMPERIRKAQQFLTDRLLPKPPIKNTAADASAPKP